MTNRINEPDFCQFVDDIQSACNIFNCNANLDIKFVSIRSTESIVQAIELLCNEIFNSYIQIDWKNEDTSNSRIYNYMIYFTNFQSRWILEKNDDYFTTFDCYKEKQSLVSPYMLVEILWKLHFDAYLIKSMLYLPVDICAEILKVLPQCILLLDFARALKFITIMVPYIYKKLDHLQNVENVSKDVVLETKKLVGYLIEIILLFDSKRLLKFENMSKLNVHGRQGLTLKALLRLATNCIKSEPLQFNKFTGNYDKNYINKLPNDYSRQQREEINQVLISILLQKIQEIDCDCYMDWTEFDDEEQPAWSLQRAIAIECHCLLKYTSEQFGGESYELLVKSLEQIASTPPKDYELKNNDSLNVYSLYSNVTQHMFQILLSKSNEDNLTNVDNSVLLKYALSVKNVMAKQNVKQLFNFVVNFVPKVLGEFENKLIKLNFENYSENVDHDYSRFDKKDPINYLLKDPEGMSLQEYKQFLIRLFFRPTETISQIVKLAIGHGKFELVYLNCNNIVMIIDVLKTPVPNFRKLMLQSLMESAGLNSKEKDDITKCCKNSLSEDRQTVPLVVQVLQKIAIDGFSSNQPQLLICFKSLYNKDVARIDLLFEEILLPLLLLPSCALDPILAFCQELVGVYESRNLFYRRLLGFLLEKLPKDRYSDRYHINELLIRVQDLLLRVFDESPKDTIVYKYCRCRYALNNVIDIQNCAYPDDFIIRSLLRHEFLYGSQKQCLDCVENLITDRGVNCGLTFKSDVEIIDLIIQTAFEACLLSIEFSTFFPPKTFTFILNLLSTILWLVKKKDTIEICKSLKKHATIISNSITKQNILSEKWEKLMTNEWKLMPDNQINFQDWINSLEKFTKEFKKETTTTKIDIKSPMAIRFYMIENIIDYLNLNDVASKLDEKLEKCFKVK